MTDGVDICVHRAGRVGRITLDRPKALNALTHDMALVIETALDGWQARADIDLILVDAAGEKAFCAGGDIAFLYESGKHGDYAPGRAFWTDEYRMNAKIADCSIPYVAIMDSIVMGGGVGISAHGSHRVATDRSVVAMPECGIGLIPDVGGTHVLARAPGHLGEFLGVSGWRMTGADAVLAGFADFLVPTEDLDAVKLTLAAEGNTACLEPFRMSVETAPLSAHLETIERHFGHGSALDCLLSLESDPSEFAVKIAKTIRRSSPLSVACTFEAIRRVRTLAGIRDALAQEYRFTYRAMADGDFLEGVRALLIDKDRDPHWRHARLEDVDPSEVDAILAPLGDAELVL